jgi:hypothetical protein
MPGVYYKSLRKYETGTQTTQFLVLTPASLTPCCPESGRQAANTEHRPDTEAGAQRDIVRLRISRHLLLVSCVATTGLDRQSDTGLEAWQERGGKSALQSLWRATAVYTNLQPLPCRLAHRH